MLSHHKVLIVLLFGALLFSPETFAGNRYNKYTAISNISYYPDSIKATDNYISERCLLDFYYPSDKKDFATVVWFHGGGLTGGDKQIPEEL